jgi:hypothetical protein
MGLASLRPGARPLRRTLDATSRAARTDSRLGALSYLNGWWYGTLDPLGCDAVRMRLPGDLGGPAPRARAALLALDRARAALLAQLAPHLWAAHRAAREPRRARAERPASRLDSDASPLHEHFRVEAVCAGAWGEDALIELALEPRWAPGRVLGAYVRAGALVEFRASIGLWRTPSVRR